MPSVLLAASITQPPCGTEIGAGQFREHCRPKARARYSSGLLHPDGALLPGESTICRDNLPPWSRKQALLAADLATRAGLADDLSRSVGFTAKPD